MRRAGVALIGVLVVAAVAGATPPGRNGPIVFARVADDRLVIAREYGGGRRVLPVTGDAPSWSPDGTRIVYMSDNGKMNGYFHLFVVAADGSGARRVTTGRMLEFQPAWSPDGTQIAFTRGSFGKPNDVYTVRPDGSRLRRLTRSLGEEYIPTWSPDGTQIAYSGQRHCAVRLLRSCSTQIFVMNADGSRKRRVARIPTRATVSSWSPDGTMLALSVFEGALDRTAPTAIATVRLDGTNFRVLTPFRHDDTAPAWSPDGTRIVFESGYPPALKSIAPDGTEQRRVARGGAAPDWLREPG